MSRHSDSHCWDDLIGPDERLIAANYDGVRQRPTRPALLLIDCYRKVFGDRPRPLAEAIATEPSTCGLAAWDALGPLERLLEGARKASVPVIHTTRALRPGRHGAATQRVRVDGEDEPDGYAFMPSLAPHDDEIVITKARASAFFGTPLSTMLRLLDVDGLVVAGETTSGCVRASVVDAYSHGFVTVVVEEAVFDRSTLAHKANLFDLDLKYASVVHLSEGLSLLRGEPRVQTDC